MIRTFSILSYAALLLVAVIQLDHSKPVHRSANERYDDPAARREWEFERLKDPATGEIPRDMRTREIAFAQMMDGQSYHTQSALIGVRDWSFAGPINAGGRAQSLGIDIADENKLVVATAQGGIWRSTDAGQSWIKASAPDQLQNCFSLVQDHRTGKTATWYCGTGELLSTTFRKASYVTAPRWRTLDVGDGIYKSVDNGVTWSLLPSTFDRTAVDLDSVFDGVWNVVIDNTTAEQDIVYAAGYGAIMRSGDGGGTWSSVLGDLQHKSFCTDVAITSTGVLYAYLSTAGSGTPSTSGVWRSIDGTHWTRITPANWPASTIRMKLAIAPSNENIVYIAGQAPDNFSEHAIWKYTYKSGDGTAAGGAWEDRSGALPSSGSASLEATNTLGGYATALAVHPTDPDVVFFGGTDVYRSTNGFANSNAVDWVGGYNPDPNGDQSYPAHHPDNHCFTFSYANPDRMYNCNDAGVFVTEDCRANEHFDAYHPIEWTDLNTGLRASLIYVSAIDHADTDQFIVGGFQDQGAWLGTPGELWEHTTGGDGCYSAIADHKTAIYTSSQFATIYRESTDSNGTEFSFISDHFNNPQFVAPWTLDPTDTRQMFVADSDRIWWNSNLDDIPASNYWYTSVNWSVLPQCTLSREAEISALALSVTPAHQLFYGTSDGHIYTIASTSANPVELASPLFPNNAFVSCISVDPESAAHLIVCFSNYHVRSLFASDDGGKNWRDISGSLEEHPDGSGDGPSVRWATLVHRQGQTLYLVATSVGLYATTDISSNVTWTHQSPNGIGRTIVEHIDARQSDGFLSIATQGAGIWTGNVVVSDSTASVALTPSQLPLTIYPNPATNFFNVSGLPSEEATITVVNSRGQRIAGALKRTSATIDCSAWPSGNYTVMIQNGEIEDQRRLIVRH